jgi:hypothetical protein
MQKREGGIMNMDDLNKQENNKIMRIEESKDG